MNFYMKSRFHIMRDYLGDLVIYIVPYRRLYGSRILCVREVIIVCALLCCYCMQLSRLYYVIWTYHVSKSLCVPFTRVILVCYSLPSLQL